MLSDDLYSAGYCIQQYDIKADVTLWRFKEESFTLPRGAVPTVKLKTILTNAAGLVAECQVGKIDDIRKAHENT